MYLFIDYIAKDEDDFFLFHIYTNYKILCKKSVFG